MSLLYADPRRPSPQVSISPADVLYVGLAHVHGVATGHVALRRLDADLEVKRMYVVPQYRRHGVGKALLDAAEAAAVRLSASRLVLHTGDRQPAAVRLYERNGYQRIPLLGPYVGLPGVCYAKQLPTNPPQMTGTMPRIHTLMRLWTRSTHRS